MAFMAALVAQNTKLGVSTVPDGHFKIPKRSLPGAFSCITSNEKLGYSTDDGNTGVSELSSNPEEVLLALKDDELPRVEVLNLIFVKI